MAVSREQLHAEVWTEPVAKVAKRYEVSGSFLARVCERLNVPRPPRGYWAATKGEQHPPIPALPPVRPCDETEWTPGGSDVHAARVPMSSNGSTEVTKASNRRHPLLFGAEEEMEAGRPTKEGYLRPKRQLFPDIFVSREQMKRAIALASRLYNELQARGADVRIAAKDSGLLNFGLDHRLDLTPRTMENSGPSYPIVQSWRPSRPTIAFVGDVAIALTIYEMSEYVKVYGDWSGPAGRYVRAPDGYERRDMPANRLAIRVGAPYRHADWGKVWRELERGDLLAKVPEIAAFIVSGAPDIARLAAEGELNAKELERQREEEQHARVRQDLAAAAKLEVETSRLKLAELISIWRRGQDLEAFLDAATREVAALDPAARVTAEQQLSQAREALAPMQAIEVLRAWHSTK